MLTTKKIKLKRIAWNETVVVTMWLSKKEIDIAEPHFYEFKKSLNRRVQIRYGLLKQNDVIGHLVSIEGSLSDVAKFIVLNNDIDFSK